MLQNFIDLRKQVTIFDSSYMSASMHCKLWLCSKLYFEFMSATCVFSLWDPDQGVSFFLGHTLPLAEDWRTEDQEETFSASKSSRTQWIHHLCSHSICQLSHMTESRVVQGERILLQDLYGKRQRWPILLWERG